MCKYENPDGFIMETALDLAVNGDVDTSRDIKAMASNNTEYEHIGIKQAKILGLVPGTKVVIRFVGKDGNVRRGLIKEFRTRTGGMYCGKRYPILVELIDEGYIFEYTLDSVVKVDDYSEFDRFNSGDDLSIALACSVDPDRKISCVNENGELSMLNSKQYLDNYNPNYLYETEIKL